MGMLAKVFVCGILLSLATAGLAKTCSNNGNSYTCPGDSGPKINTVCCGNQEDLTNTKCCPDIGVIAGPVIAGGAVITVIVLIGACVCCRVCPCCECCKRTPCYKKEVVRDREKDGWLGYIAVKVVDRQLEGENQRIDPGQHERYDSEKPLLHQ